MNSFNRRRINTMLAAIGLVGGMLLSNSASGHQHHFWVQPTWGVNWNNGYISSTHNRGYYYRPYRYNHLRYRYRPYWQNRWGYPYWPNHVYRYRQPQSTRIIVSPPAITISSSKVHYSNAIKTLPQNARVIQRNGHTIYRWQGQEYTYNWMTDSYHRLTPTSTKH